jgi:hypothetical protein
MLKTQTADESSIFIEEPLVSGECPSCGRRCKKGIDPDDNPILLTIPYQITSIQQSQNSGRSFQKVRTGYVHLCPTKHGVHAYDHLQPLTAAACA